MLSGAIKDVSQIPALAGFASGANNSGVPGVNIGGKDVIEEIAKIKKREMVNKMLPFIIIAVVLIIFATIYFTKHANRK